MALGFRIGSAVNVTHKQCSQQLLTWGWIVSSLHIKIIRRRQHKTLRRASSKGISILEEESVWTPQTGRNRRYSVLWICRPPSEWCWLPPPGVPVPSAKTSACLAWDIGDFWHCNSNPAAAQKSPRTSPTLLVQNLRELPCSTFGWDTSPRSGQALLPSLPGLGHSSSLAPVPRCVSSL